MKHVTFLVIFFNLLVVIGCQKSNEVNNSDKLVLIYNGAGVSQTEAGYTGNAYCWDSIATSFGYKTKLITGNEDIRAYYSKNTIWVQPGGEALIQADSMPENLKKQIIDFVAAGGAYVGSCAGGFIAGEVIAARDTTGLYTAKGLGLIPDTVWDDLTTVIESEYGLYNVFLQTNWEGFGQVDLYWWWGCNFSNKNLVTNSKILAYYPNSTRALSIQTYYKKGALYITGVHPEATFDWYKEFINPPTQPIQYQKTRLVAKSMLDWAFQNNNYGN